MISRGLAGVRAGADVEVDVGPRHASSSKKTRDMFSS